MRDLPQLLRRLKRLRILVVGHVMPDHYIWGDATRISPEAPVPVIDIARDFTLQPGVPLVKAEAGRCESGRTRVTLTPGRFETGPPSTVALPLPIPVMLGGVEL